MVDDLSDPWAAIKALQAAVRRLENSTMLQNSSITRGALRVASAEGLIVEGSAKVTGLLAGDGTFDWDGPAFIRDTLDVEAETTLRSLVTLMADLVLSTGGKITSGNVVIDPSDSGGTIKVGELKIIVTGGGVNLSAYGHQIVFNISGISIVTAGGKNIVMQSSPSVFRFGGLPTRTSATSSNAVAGTVWSDTSGNLYRIIT